MVLNISKVVGFLERGIMIYNAKYFYEFFFEVFLVKLFVYI